MTLSKRKQLSFNLYTLKKLLSPVIIIECVEDTCRSHSVRLEQSRDNNHHGKCLINITSWLKKIIKIEFKRAILNELRHLSTSEQNVCVLDY